MKAGGTPILGPPPLLFQSKEDLNRWSSVSAVDLFEAVLAMLQTTLRSAGMDQQTRFSENNSPGRIGRNLVVSFTC